MSTPQTNPMPKKAINLQVNTTTTKNESPSYTKSPDKGIKIEKPNTEKEKPGLGIFDQPIIIRQAQKQQEETGAPKIEKRNKKVLDVVRAGKYYERKEFEMLDKEDDNNEVFNRSSVGYISLMNYLKEQNSNQNKGNYNKNPKKMMKPSRNAKFVVKDENRYIPATMAKVAKVWKDDSQEAFEASLNFLLNKLTEKQIDKTKEELMKHIETEKHKDIVVKTLVEKAQFENAFSMIYAKFAKVLDEDLKNNIILKAKTEFEDYDTNPPQTDGDGVLAVGISKFIAALISIGLIKYEDGQDYINSILEKCISPKDCDPKSDTSSYYVEMLEVFIKTAGPEFCRNIKPETWTKFDEVLAEEGPSTRKGCLLLNVKELKDEWLSKEKRNRTSSVEVINKDEVEMYISNAYCDFKEDSKMDPCPFHPCQFLEAALNQLTDHIKDAPDYGLFIGTVLSRTKPFDMNERQKVLKEFAITIEKEKLINESPKIWSSFLIVIVALYVLAQFQLSGADDIFDSFPEDHPKIDWNNEAQYFLYEYHSFNKAIELKRHPRSKEIQDALAIPNTITKYNENSKYSRLISVAICRFVVDVAFNVEEEKISSVFSKYAIPLKVVINRFKPVFEEEFSAAIDDGLPCTLRDVARIVGANY